MQWYGGSGPGKRASVGSKPKAQDVRALGRHQGKGIKRFETENWTRRKLVGRVIEMSNVKSFVAKLQRANFQTFHKATITLEDELHVQFFYPFGKLPAPFPIPTMAQWRADVLFQAFLAAVAHLDPACGTYHSLAITKFATRHTSPTSER